MAETKGENLMGLVHRHYLYKHTMAEVGEGNNHWIDLVEAVLALKPSTRAVLGQNGWYYPSHAVKAVLKVPPYELQEILDSKGVSQ